jgi:hypothetical protein
MSGDIFRKMYPSVMTHEGSVHWVHRLASRITVN